MFKCMVEACKLRFKFPCDTPRQREMGVLPAFFCSSQSLISPCRAIMPGADAYANFCGCVLDRFDVSGFLKLVRSSDPL